MLAVVGSATYHWKLKKRSLAAFRMRRRYVFGSSVTVGYATPLTIGVSLNCSMPTEMFGVPGICCGLAERVGLVLPGGRVVQVASSAS